MNNIVVYCETNGNSVADVSLELLTKAHSLASLLKVQVEAVLIGDNLKGIEKKLFAHGAHVVHKAEDPRLEFYQTLPHTSILCKIMDETKPQIGLFGATTVGRDLAPSRQYRNRVPAMTKMMEHGGGKVKAKWVPAAPTYRPG